MLRCERPGFGERARSESRSRSRWDLVDVQLVLTRLARHLECDKQHKSLDKQLCMRCDVGVDLPCCM